MDPPSFSDITAECEYWKLRSQKYLEELTVVKAEFDDFIHESHGIETEMDATLEQKMRKIKELTAIAAVNEREKEALEAKLNSKSTEISTMAEKLASMTQEIESMKVDVRILEQSNDNLEQAQRVANESKETVENLLFEQYEKYALLEDEVEGKRVLEEELQRLRDEIKDLRQELRTRDIQLALKTVESNASLVGDGSDDESLKSLKQRKAARKRFTPRNLKQELGASQVQSAGGAGAGAGAGGGTGGGSGGGAGAGAGAGAGDSMTAAQLEVGSNLELFLRKRVGDIVNKLDNLDAKVRDQREKIPLSRPPSPAS